MSASLEYDDARKGELEHVESLEKPSAEIGPIHSSATLAAMPMAPSAELLTQAVELAEAEKLMPPSQAFRAEVVILLFCLAYVFPSMAQGFDNGAANISV